MLSVPQQTYTNVPHPHSLLSLLGTEGFSTKGSLFAVVQISFPMCSESVLFHFPSIPAPLYRHTYPVLSMKSKFTFSRLPQVLALCSLLQQKFMKGFPTFNISLPYPQFTIQPAQKCVMTQSFQEENYINVSKSTATFLAIHLTLSNNKHTLFLASWTLLRVCTYVLATHFCPGQALSLIHSSLWQYFKAHSTIRIPPCYFFQSHSFKEICSLMHLQCTAITFFPLLLTSQRCLLNPLLFLVSDTSSTEKPGMLFLY